MPYTNPTATPGVYIQEGPPGARPIQGVATSVVAFIGMAPAGPINTPTKVTGWLDFERTFGRGTRGPFMDGAYLAHSVRGYFLNGGTLAWIVRVGTETFDGRPMHELPSRVADAPVPYEVAVKEGVSLVDADQKPITFTVELKADAPAPAAGKAAGGDAAAKSPPAVPTFTATVTGDPAGEPETVGPGLTTTPGHNSIATRITAESRIVDVILAGGVFASTELVPADGKYKLAPAAPPPPPDAGVVAGDPARMTGLAGLAIADEVTTICVPDLMALTQDDEDIKSVQQIVTAFCAGSRRMAIFDPPPAMNDQEIAAWRAGTVTTSPFATLYWPWLDVKDPSTGQTVHVPPSGHVAGAWAATDASRGVHKSPANVALAGVVGLGFAVTDAGQDALNRTGVNCIRAFPGRGTLIWGARTLETDGDWRYINVRRLFNYLMASILDNTQWAVFEPNDELLWGQLTVSVTNFLTRTWRTGALFGATPDAAFFVKCDAETNPPDLIEAGQVNMKVGVAPARPAEFVVFEIKQFQPGV
jgi:phage tail sheath protein FI